MKKKLLIVLILNFVLVKAYKVNAQPIDDSKFFYQKSWVPGYGVKKKLDSDVFQGNNKKKKYFEGWYFKMVSADESSVISVIPGISLSEDGKTNHAFIQVINGKTVQTFYYAYPLEEFVFSRKGFAAYIGENFFSRDFMVLDIVNDSTSITGNISMYDQSHQSNKHKKKKSAMGWFRFFPFMQCYHEVVSYSRSLQGSIKIDDVVYNFYDGKGYIEKDWGKSMPSEWIWMQSNNFSSEETSFMLSIANVPWMGASFTGFTGFFLHDGELHRFGTYNQANFKINSSNDERLNITLKDKSYTYNIEAYASQSGLLVAPVNGGMDRHISESIDAKLIIKITEKNGDVVYNDSTTVAGLEVVGDVDELKRRKDK